MGIIDGVKHEAEIEEAMYKHGLEERIEKAATEAAERLVCEIKHRIKYGIYDNTLTFKKRVEIEMPYIEVQRHMTDTPQFSPGYSDSHVDCYYVRTEREKCQFIKAIEDKLHKNGVETSLVNSKYGDRRLILRCRYSWR